MPILLLQALTWCIHALYTRIQAHIISKKPYFLFQEGEHMGSTDYTPDIACKVPELLDPKWPIFVTRVEWRKTTLSPFHEFLVVHVQEERSDGVKPRKSVIMIDRLVSHLARRQDAEEPPNSNPQNVTLLGWDWRRKNLSTGDQLNFSSDGTDSYVELTRWPNITCRTLSIDGPHMSITQLIVVSRTVSRHCRSYHLAEYQSFWFADMVYNTIKDLVDDSTKSLGTGSCQEKNAWTSLRPGHFKPDGKLIVAKQGSEDTARLIAEEYRTALSEIQANKNARKRVDTGPKAVQAERVQADGERAKIQANTERKKAGMLKIQLRGWD